jgi:topoisomerase IV subunit B
MIFITEGQSAAGSLVSCRDVNTQAIFTLKGKPLNVRPEARRALQERRDLQPDAQPEHRGEYVDNLRYQQVIMATDADVDGLHIRNLMITFFLRFFRAAGAAGASAHPRNAAVPRAQQEGDGLLLFRAERDAAVRRLGRPAWKSRASRGWAKSRPANSSSSSARTCG